MNYDRSYAHTHPYTNTHTQVVKKLVEDAAAALVSSRAAAEARIAEAEAAQKAWLAKQAELKEAAEAAELAEVKAKATFILSGELQPPIVEAEAASEVRGQLEAAAQADADAAFEAAKAAAAGAAREKAEAKAAEQAARLEAMRAAAAPAGGEEGAEEEGGGAPEPALDEPLVDVEAEVAAATDAVIKPEPAPVTDGAVLSALLDKGVVTKDAIVQSLAIHALGGQAYTRLFEPPPTAA